MAGFQISDSLWKTRTFGIQEMGDLLWKSIFVRLPRALSESPASANA